LTTPASGYDNSNLASQLNVETDALRTFITLLEKEQLVLLSQDSEALISLADEKSQAAFKLNEIANTRRKQLNLEATHSDMTDWVQKFAPDIRETWEEILSLAAHAHHLNKTNGEVIQLKLRSNQKALTVLLGAAQDAAGLYGRDGQPNMPISGRTLGNG
jgi:flagella synthesis protein FlgN